MRTGAGALVAIGVLVQVATSFAVHPLAFLSFALVGCALTALGVLAAVGPLLGFRRDSEALSNGSLDGSRAPAQGD